MLGWACRGADEFSQHDGRATSELVKIAIFKDDESMVPLHSVSGPFMMYRVGTAGNTFIFRKCEINRISRAVERALSNFTGKRGRYKSVSRSLYFYVDAV